MEINNHKEIDIESEIFALINSIINISQKYQEGVLKTDFFRRAIKSTMNNLLNLNFELKKNNINLNDLLERMNFKERYYKAIDIMNEISTLDFKKINDANKSLTGNLINYDKKLTSSVLDLPATTSEITSAFITLMDAIKLEAFKESDILYSLFKDLKTNLEKFPGTEDILKKIKEIKKHITINKKIFIEKDEYRERVVDHIYNIFQEFQKKLKLN